MLNIQRAGEIPPQCWKIRGKFMMEKKYALLYQTSQFILKEYLFGQGTEKKNRNDIFTMYKTNPKTVLNIKEQYVYLMKGQNSTKVLKQKYKTEHQEQI